MPIPSPDFDSFDLLPRQPARRISVLVGVPLPTSLTYALPVGLTAEPGQVVAVTVMNRPMLGVVWDDPPDQSVPEEKLKPVDEVFEAPPMAAVTRRFVDWIAAYTLNPPGLVLRLCLSSAAAASPRGPRTAFQLDGPPPERMTGARRRVIDLLADGLPRGLAELIDETGVSPSVIKGLETAGTLARQLLPPPKPFAAPDPNRPGPTLSPAQARAAASLIAHVEAHEYSVALLEGVTGSGKTEVYLEAVAATLRQGRQALVLLPEIALTAQVIDRLAQRFGARPAEWHSELGQTRRRETWRAVAAGEAPLVVGARSALFLPYPDLGLIVIDEEHEASFKQEDGVIYHARDMAIVRGKLGQFPVILSSATPSLETLVNAEQGRYEHYQLTERHAAASLPEVRAIDLRRDPPPRGRFLSPRLTEAIAETIAAGEQALLFLNRRGYAPLTLCGQCGHRLNCPQCSAWLVEHRFQRQLQCHHCGYRIPVPSHCPSCDGEGTLKPCGPGVERLSEEIVTLFPDARIALMASDTLTGPGAIQTMIEAIAEHRVDIIIGTQIVAKGHHFPGLTLVGVVDADLGLAGGDLRAGERTHQLLTQVAGRAGRADKPGRVMLQTFDSANPVIAALVKGDAPAFISAEKAARQAAGMPPYGRLAALILSGPDDAKLAPIAAELARRAPDLDGVEIWGPVPAPLALLRGRHRIRFLLKAGRQVDVQQILRGWLSAIKLPANVRLAIDIDPYSFW